MKYIDAQLDNVATETLVRLHNEGYVNVNTSHIAFFKDIYDFICRFADESYGESNIIVQMSDSQIPKETRKIIETIGYENLWKYFSPMEYKKRFYSFCKKLIKIGRIISEDYITDGTIVTTKIEVEEMEYEMEVEDV